MRQTYPPLGEIFPALKTAQACQKSRKNLKGDIKSDLAKRAVWFNDLELADYHAVNGQKILCVFDRYDAAVAAIDSGRAGNKDAAALSGLQSDLYLLFIRADEYNGTPRIGQEIKVDGRKLYVRDSVAYDGVYEMTLKGGAVR